MATTLFKHDREKILLVADASESALPFWQVTVDTIRKIYEQLPDEISNTVMLLGSQHTLNREQFFNNSFPTLQAPVSLIAPVITTLRLSRQKAETIIIVGCGEIFDLADHISSPQVNRWIMVQTGEDSLQPSEVSVLEVDHQNIEAILANLSSVQESRSKSGSQTYSIWGSTDCEWSLDKCGFPMVLVPEASAWVSVFPVFKAQFEQFLASDCGLGDRWYEEILALNPRLSYNDPDLTTYEQLILTGIFPQETDRYLHWLGRQYRLLDIAQWRQVYRFFQTQAAAAPPLELERAGLSPVAKRLWERLLDEITPKTLLELSLMEHGVIEWVMHQGKYVGLGHTRNSFREALGDPLFGDPIRPNLSIRQKHFGCRTFRRG